MPRGYKKPSYYIKKIYISKFAYFQPAKVKKHLENFEWNDETIFRTILIREKIIR